MLIRVHYDAYPITDQKSDVSLQFMKRLNASGSTHRVDCLSFLLMTKDHRGEAGA